MRKGLLIAFIVLIGVVGFGGYKYKTIDKTAFSEGSKILAEVTYVSEKEDQKVHLEVGGEQIEVKMNKEKIKALKIGDRVEAVKYGNSYRVDPEYR
ncbi:hypothetical protein ACQUY5_25130 [Bacillus cereus]|uniref:hypothetical protein n=1 Tax=Bacillus cereus TaxID=1396 RepID=UPI003D168617